MAKELRKKENQTIKYKTMATPFKMKSSPTKGKLGNFFKSVGANLKRNKKDIGADLKEKYNRTKESTPKAGESKYQASVRTRKATRKATRKSKPGEFTTKQKLENKLVPNQELMKKEVPKASNPKPKPPKKTGYENATSVNAMVVQRTKFNANPKNKGKKYPGQAEINKRLKKNPKKFD